MTDADITTAIERLFTTQKGMSEHSLDVTTQKGVVILSGFTHNLLAQQRAEEIAWLCAESSASPAPSP